MTQRQYNAKSKVPARANISLGLARIEIAPDLLMPPNGAAVAGILVDVGDEEMPELVDGAAGASGTLGGGSG